MVVLIACVLVLVLVLGSDGIGLQLGLRLRLRLRLGMADWGCWLVGLAAGREQEVAKCQVPIVSVPGAKCQVPSARCQVPGGQMPGAPGEECF